jgi:hypothetical protein
MAGAPFHIPEPAEPDGPRKGHMLAWSIVLGIVVIALWLGSNLLADRLANEGHPVCRPILNGMECPLSIPTTTASG